MTRNKVERRTHEALREMYSEAEPSLDFDDVLENPDEYGSRWYENYVLPSVRQREIVDKYCEGLTKRERTAVIITAIMDFGPRSTALDED